MCRLPMLDLKHRMSSRVSSGFKNGGSWTFNFDNEDPAIPCACFFSPSNYIVPLMGSHTAGSCSDLSACMSICWWMGRSRIWPIFESGINPISSETWKPPQRALYATKEHSSELVTCRLLGWMLKSAAWKSWASTLHLNPVNYFCCSFDLSNSQSFGQSMREQRLAVWSSCCLLRCCKLG